MPNLTDEQIIIVKAPLNINIVVDAVPGSGKTTTIVHKIVFMINEYKVLAKSIAMFTYNRSLGQDMSIKLKKLGVDPCELFWCGTLHAFCYQTTKNYQDLKSWINMFDVNNINALKYIIFDEYQDSEKDIASILSILSKDCYLTIIGDKKQQLYEFRGASINHLLKIKDIFVTYTLSKTFRCNRNICELLNKIWINDTLNIHSDINGPRPLLYRSKSNAMNNPNITDELVRLVDKYKDRSIAIISPTVNSDVSKRFLNDIHSNILEKNRIIFDQCLDEIKNSRDYKESKYLISSIHEVKGLEYDTVILLNAIDNEYFFDVPTYEAQCKLFVACSRARQNLVVFENNYHFSNGSIKWISDNEDLFDKVWYLPAKQRQINQTNNKIEKSCRDFIRTLTSEQRYLILKNYGPSEIVRMESGLGNHIGEPLMSGKLIEFLLATKLQFNIKFEFKAFITLDEWNKTTKENEIPNSVIDKIHKVYPYTDVKIQRKHDGTKFKILILFIDTIRLRYSKCPVDIRFMVESHEITENSIVSEFMCNEYYKYLDTAHDIRNLVLSATNCNVDFVKNIWWLLRFECLMKMRLTDFNQPDLTDQDIQTVLDYIQNTYILSEMSISKYHPMYRRRVFLEKIDDIELWIRGEVDFECNDAFLEVKCSNSNDLEDAWIQVMIYNLIADTGNKLKYNKVYVYNAITGTLYQRKTLS